MASGFGVGSRRWAMGFRHPANLSSTVLAHVHHQLVGTSSVLCLAAPTLTLPMAAVVVHNLLVVQPHFGASQMLLDQTTGPRHMLVMS